MTNYSQSHLAPSKGLEYDESYLVGHEAHYWSHHESPLLLGIFKDLVQQGKVDFLDVACGTGRISQIIHDSPATVTGVDVSPSMLAQAREKIPSATFLEADITQDSIEVGNSPDVVTLFRFILNAEDTLRGQMLNAINRLLEIGGSFVVNNHNNPLSPVNLKLHFLRMKGRDKTTKTLSHGEMRKLLAAHGFSVRKTFGVHIIPTWHGKPLFGKTATPLIEDFLVSLPIIKLLARNIIYVCEKDRDVRVDLTL